MAHRREIDQNARKEAAYSIEDALKIADDVLKLGKEKKYNLGAFVHGLVFALEYMESSYKIPPQQIADIKRGCRKYFKEIENIRTNPKS